MSTLRDLFADYAEHHRTAGNKWCHRVGIPLIMLSLLGMLARITIWPGNTFRLDAAVVLIFLTAIYYVRLEPKLGSLMVIVAALFYVVGARLPLPVNAALFIAGWILQFVGHARYEKRQPAFLKNLTHLLVGPLWLLDSAVGATRRRTARAS